MIGLGRYAFNRGASRKCAPGHDSKLRSCHYEQGKYSNFSESWYAWGSIVDLTFASQRIAGVILNWAVREDYTASDYQYIPYEVHSIQGKSSTTSDCGLG